MKYRFFEENVLNNQYNQYYLLDYRIEFYQKTFFDKLKKISIDTESIIFEECMPKVILEIPINNLSKAYFEKTTFGNRTIDIELMNEFFLYDSNELWKIYAFQIDDICIIGISDTIQEKFNHLFKGYISTTKQEIKTKELLIDVFWNKSKQKWARERLKILYNI